jgi:hypothetical protein
MMLKQPFSGKELFIEYEFQMGRFDKHNFELQTELEETSTAFWDTQGKTKKQAWNNLAKMINQRMQNEAI